MITTAVITSRFPLETPFLKSLDFSDEIIVVVDKNKKIKESTDAKLKYYFRELKGDFASQRNFALQKSSGDWVLFVDDDEYLSKELIAEILEVIKTNKYSGYIMKRKDVVFHELQSYGETGDIKILRLAKKKAGQFVRNVHERWKIEAEVGELDNFLYHNKDHFISEFIGRMAKYGEIDAKALPGENKPFTYLRLLANPIGKFCHNYLIKSGYKDGYPGLFSSFLMSVQSLTVRVFQWQNRK